MALSVRHSFVSLALDKGQPGRLGPEEWNADLLVTCNGDTVLGRATAGPGDAEEIVCTAAGRALLSGVDASSQRVTLGAEVAGAAAAAAAAAQAASQPLDSDLTAIAALATTSYGRALLALADGTALAALVDSFFLAPAEGNAAYQPLDSDLTAIAALSTTSFGRAILALADAAALAALVDSFFLTPAEANAAYQSLDATLTALAALDSTTGLLEQTGADTFVRRALGVGASTSVPTRADADTRYSAAAHAHAASEVTSGVLDIARLATGTPDGTKFVRDDGTLAVPAGGVSDGDKGNITVSGSGATWTIDNDVVTYAKMQDVSATDMVLGRSTAGAGDVQEIPCTSFGRALLVAASASIQRTALALSSASDVAFRSLSLLTTGASIVNLLVKASASQTANRTEWQDSSGGVQLSVTAAGAFQFTEMTAPAAPATNSVRLYAEDNGSGKTRLMALFPTGAAVQLAVEP